jgi:hypothetical protein
VIFVERSLAGPSFLVFTLDNSTWVHRDASKNGWGRRCSHALSGVGSISSGCICIVQFGSDGTGSNNAYAEHMHCGAQHTGTHAVMSVQLHTP